MSEQTIPTQAGLAPTAIALPGAETGTPEAPSTEPPRRRRRRLVILAILLTLLGIFALFAGWYLVTRKPIAELPLPPASVVNLPDYGFSIYGVSQPTGVAVNAAGDRIYVAQTGGDMVVKIFDGKGTALGVAKPPATAGLEHVPVYVAVNPTNGDVYVTDRMTAAIYVYSADGVYRRTFDPGKDLEGWLPLGIGFKGDGTMYVTDLAGPSPRVHEFGPDGKYVKSYGKDGQLSYPNGVAVDGSGNLYVANSNNGRLEVFAADGRQKATVARGAREGDLGLPRGVAVDDGNRVYVADTSGHAVQVYKALGSEDRKLTYIGRFGIQGSADGAFQFPNGVAVDQRGRIYVTDLANNRVQVWSY